MIVLDTNQLRTAAFPHGAVLGMLRKIAEIHGHTLALPEMVAVEHTAHYRHDVEEALKAARKAAVMLDQAFGGDVTSQLGQLDPAAAADSHRAALERVFTVLPAPPGSADEALRREANRQPPAKQHWNSSGNREEKARGARDVAIWLTVLDAALTQGEPVWFVTMDEDFGKERLHPQLEEEAEQKLAPHPDRLRLMSGGIDQILGELAESAEQPANLNDLVQGPVAAYAVNIALTQGALFMRLIAGMPVDSEGYFRSGSVLLKPERIKRSRTYRVEDRTWVSVQMRWHATKVLERMGLDSPDAVWVEEVDMEFETTLLLEIEEEHARSAEVVSLGPISIAPSASTTPGFQGAGAAWMMNCSDPSEPNHLFRVQYGADK